MSWDDPKETRDELTSSEWNDHVEDQKGHSSRHEKEGGDEIQKLGEITADQVGEPESPTNRFLGIATLHRRVIKENESVTIPEDYGSVVVGPFTVDGSLTIDGKQKVL